ncbi:MAG: hypothetical protein NDJ92_17900 [Thermoanaerobaculia bacterium]|nr:hypothetical protein [Thermoanaerobaculia bacterium]
MRLTITILAILSILLASCLERTPAQMVLWRETLELREQSTANPASLEAKQRYVDALATYLHAYPDDAEALALYETEELAYARELVRRGRHNAAIPYYVSILSRNPGHAEARAELETARAQASVPREKFDELRRGMTQEEVRELLGATRPGWTHTLEKGSSTYETWYYRKPDGSKASVGFVDGKAFVAEYDGVIRLEP